MPFPLEKAKANLKAYQASKKPFTCDKCGYVIKISPPFPAVMQHKDCNGTFKGEDF